MPPSPSHNSLHLPCVPVLSTSSQPWWQRNSEPSLFSPGKCHHWLHACYASKLCLCSEWKGRRWTSKIWLAYFWSCDCLPGKTIVFLHRITMLFGCFDGLTIAYVGECPLDPGGYFVVKGNEKVTKNIDVISSIVLLSWNWRIFHVATTYWMAILTANCLFLTHKFLTGFVFTNVSGYVFMSRSLLYKNSYPRIVLSFGPTVKKGHNLCWITYCVFYLLVWILYQQILVFLGWKLLEKTSVLSIICFYGYSRLNVVHLVGKFTLSEIFWWIDSCYE